MTLPRSTARSDHRFDLGPDRDDFRAVIAGFAAAEVGPYAADWDADHRFPLAVVEQLGRLGVFGLHAPAEYGGAGDFTDLCIAIEELGRVDQSLGITVEAAAGLGISPIAHYASPEQKQRWLPDLIAGRALAGFGLTEPETGSDAGATRTRAELVDDHWLIDGSKQFITNSGTPITSLVTVTARTGTRPDGRAEISAIIVPAGADGFVVEPAYRKLGWHSSDTHPLSLSRVRVPADHLLGQRGRGYAQFLATLDDGRVAIAALALGCIRACRDLALDHAGRRTAFGVPIGRKQAVAFQLAELDAMAHAGHLLVYAAAAMRDAIDAGHGPGMAAYKRAAAIAKLRVCQDAVTATRTAVQIFGGYGFMEEFPIARFYRDAKILEIGEGTSEVQHLVIARGLGLDVE